MIRKRIQPGVVKYTYEPVELAKFYEKNLHKAALIKLTEVVLKLVGPHHYNRSKDNDDLEQILEKLRGV